MSLSSACPPHPHSDEGEQETPLDGDEQAVETEIGRRR
jgi:hypothetical protein